MTAQALAILQKHNDFRSPYAIFAAVGARIPAVGARDLGWPKPTHGDQSYVYTDETLSCVDCNSQFIFTSGEQQFFASKGFQNKPNRCPDCRNARKAQRGAAGGGGFGAPAGGPGAVRGAREMFATTCSQCGQSAEVPFQPRGDKPVYCRDCFSTRSGSYR